ncbi:MAG: RnfABCDGE type electron transport complex subunit D [Spirochaetaceae bacterium]|jgi:electron transport complex protein RnfD|nr:RnfABCDGE type electron transport complex subunit D [Spirochaetaceae bacterium]
MPELYLGSSPHIGTSVRTQTIMAHVLIALAPVTIFGVVLYGLPALGVIAVSVASAAAGEALFRYILRLPNRSADLSAVVTGLLLALILPPSTPLWMAALGAVFAVVVAKEFFGGLGANVFNPALIGRAFLLMSFPVAITQWTIPGPGISEAALSGADAVSAASGLSLDTISGATPLGIVKMGGTPLDVARHFTAAGLSTEATFPELVTTLFMGSHGGSIGESSILLILAGCLYLLAMKVLDWRAPAAMILSVFAFSFILGLNPVFAVLAGGLVFGAVFMASDYTTAPLTAAGKLIFGAGAGIITVLIRKWGNYPEGVTFGILIMNAVTPFLNRLLQKKYGYVKKPRKRPEAA